MKMNDLRKQVSAGIKAMRSNYDSDAQHARALGINKATLSRVKAGSSSVSEAMLITLARKLELTIGDNFELTTARTAVFEFVQGQLSACQSFSLSGLLCDAADIGKTYAAKYYARNNKNAKYIDCSQCKTKSKLIRAIAQSFGINYTAYYSDVYADLIYFLRSTETPLIILDEAGDLQYEAFLELKALWNATEHSCGWYMMGADGLKAKIERNLNHKKVGYTELFSRFGSRYQKVSPDGGEEHKQFIMQQVAMIAAANGIEDVRSLYARTQGSLRRIYTEIQKLRRDAV